MTRAEAGASKTLSQGFHDLFRRFAHQAAERLGSSLAFVLAVALVAGWAAAGPFYGYSDSWELVINTSTTIITFLMVFLIQNTQNRDAMAIHLKLDELLRAVEGARNKLMNLESLSDEEMAHLKAEFARLNAQECADTDETDRGPAPSRR